MNVTGTGLSSIQSSIHTALETLTSGAGQVKSTQAALINTALDTFQSVNLEAGQTLFNALPAVSEIGSFADPVSFYKAQDGASPVLQELKNPAFQPAPHLKRLSNDLHYLQGDSVNLVGEKTEVSSMIERCSSVRVKKLLFKKSMN